jgi:hypothetical protein
MSGSIPIVQSPELLMASSITQLLETKARMALLMVDVSCSALWKVGGGQNSSTNSKSFGSN